MGYSIIILSLAAVVVAAWLIQMILLLVVNRRVLSHIKSEKKDSSALAAEDKPGVSVLIYAHNQGDSLMRNLPVLLDNDYPDFEVIVIDDMSCDDTQNVLTIMEQRSEHFFHTKITDKVRTMSHRKLALLLGVKAAHHDIIVTTKAQCIPATKDWLSSMVRNMDDRTEIVLGPMVFESRRGIVARFCQYDLLQRMISLFGITLSFRAFAGWGDNMAFRKHLLFDDNNKAFSSHLDIHPGDDDLFVAAMARRRNVKVECTPESIIVKQEDQLTKAWSKDRVTRAFTAKRYAMFPKLIKVLDYATRYLCVLPGLAIAIYAGLSFDWILMSSALALLVLRVLTIATLTYLTTKELGVRRYFYSPICYDLLIPVVDLVFWIRATLGQRTFYVGRV